MPAMFVALAVLSLLGFVNAQVKIQMCPHAVANWTENDIRLAQAWVTSYFVNNQQKFQGTVTWIDDCEVDFLRNGAHFLIQIDMSPVKEKNGGKVLVKTDESHPGLILVRCEPLMKVARKVGVGNVLGSIITVMVIAGLGDGGANLGWTEDDFRYTRDGILPWLTNPQIEAARAGFEVCRKQEKVVKQ